MAFLRFDGARAPLDLADQDLVRFGGSLTRQNDFWRFTNAGGHDIEVAGRNFAFDQQGRPIAGTVSEVRLDIGGDFGVRDVIVTGLSISPTSLDDNPVAFWDAVLSGNDVINVQGLDKARVGGTGGSVVFGDGLVSARSIAAGAVTDSGGNDAFITGDGSYTLIGDVQSVAGGTRLVVIPAQPGGGGKPPVSGGIVTVTEFAHFVGGNDTITGAATAARQAFTGDVESVLGRGTLIGGNDTISSASRSAFTEIAGDAFIVSGAAADQMARVHGGNDTITGLEPAQAGGSRAHLVGDVGRVDDFAEVFGGRDTIRGSDEDEFISGDVGHDNSSIGSLIRGGADNIDGGGGDDVIAGDVLAPIAFEVIGNGGATIVGGDDTLRGGAGDDVVFGDVEGGALENNPGRLSGGNDRLFGDAGDDLLFGQTGDDVLDGGAGLDRLEGGLGNDRYVLGADNDTIVDTGGFDTITTTVSRTLVNGAIERLILEGSGNIDGTGNGGANLIVGNAGDNVLAGLGGQDGLSGGLGNDTYVLEDGADTVTDTGGVDTITSTIARSLAGFGQIERLVLAGSSDINGAGNGLNNVLFGNSGRNALAGGGGNDLLVGGLGRDVLTGGADNDVFDFNTVAETGTTANTRDAISDFVRGQDRIDLSTIDANGALTGDPGFVFIGEAAFTSGAGRLRYFQVDNLIGTDQTIIEGDIDGNGAADFQIQLTGLIDLVAADFVL